MIRAETEEGGGAVIHQVVDSKHPRIFVDLLSPKAVVEEGVGIVGWKHPFGKGVDQGGQCRRLLDYLSAVRVSRHQPVPDIQDTSVRDNQL
jgi:hypothetical protein